MKEISLKILHPLHCLESKRVNLITLPQSSGDRQDLKHLRLSIAILRQHLLKLTIEAGSEQLLLRWAHRIRMNSNHELGVQAALRYGINFQDTIPSEAWVMRPGPLADFMNVEWHDWKKEIAEKISDLRELENWLDSLNRLPKGPAQ